MKKTRRDRKKSLRVQTYEQRQRRADRVREEIERKKGKDRESCHQDSTETPWREGGRVSEERERERERRRPKKKEI